MAEQILGLRLTADELYDLQEGLDVYGDERLDSYRKWLKRGGLRAEGLPPGPAPLQDDREASGAGGDTMKRPTDSTCLPGWRAVPPRAGEARVEVDPALWHDERRDGGLLRCTLRVNGLPIHLEAVAVRQGRAGIMVAEVPEDEERLLALDGMYSARWGTTSIVPPGRRRARRYVLFAVPFGD